MADKVPIDSDVIEKLIEWVDGEADHYASREDVGNGARCAYTTYEQCDRAGCIERQQLTAILKAALVGRDASRNTPTRHLFAPSATA